MVVVAIAGKLIGETVDSGEQGMHLRLDPGDTLGACIRSIAEAGGHHHEQVAPEQPLASGRHETRCTVGIERLRASFVEKRIEGFSRAIASPNCLGSNPGDVVRCLAPEHELECLVEVGVDRSI